MSKYAKEATLEGEDSTSNQFSFFCLEDNATFHEERIHRFLGSIRNGKGFNECSGYVG